MPRETKEFTTPGGHVVVVNSFITGREDRALTDMYIDKAGSELDKPKISSDLINSAENLGWKTVIVSIDGHKEGDDVDGKPFSVVDTILDFPLEEATFVREQVNEITRPKKKPATT